MVWPIVQLAAPPRSMVNLPKCVRFRLYTPKLSSTFCHPREGGDPWSDISTHETILVRTKTQRHEATSMCLRAFVRTLFPTCQTMDPRLRGDDNVGLFGGQVMKTSPQVQGDRMETSSVRNLLIRA